VFGVYFVILDDLLSQWFYCWKHHRQFSKIYITQFSKIYITLACFEDELNIQVVLYIKGVGTEFSLTTPALLFSPTIMAVTDATNIIADALFSDNLNGFQLFF